MKYFFCVSGKSKIQNPLAISVEFVGSQRKYKISHILSVLETISLRTDKSLDITSKKIY